MNQNKKGTNQTVQLICVFVLAFSDGGGGGGGGWGYAFHSRQSKIKFVITVGNKKRRGSSSAKRDSFHQKMR